MGQVHYLCKILEMRLGSLLIGYFRIMKTQIERAFHGIRCLTDALGKFECLVLLVKQTWVRHEELFEEWNRILVPKSAFRHRFRRGPTVFPGGSYSESVSFSSSF